MAPKTDEKDNALPPDLAALEALALAQDSALDGAAVLPGAEQVAEPVSNRPEELAAMLQMGVMMVAPALPFLPQCYTPEVCGQIGTAFDAVATKYGWNIDNVMTPELALACVAVPPTISAVMLGRSYFAHRRAEQAATQQAAKLPPLPSAHAGQLQQPSDRPALMVVPT